MVLTEAQQHGIVDDAAVFRGDDDILTLADGAAREITRGKQVGEPRCVLSRDLDLAFDRDIPQRHMLNEMPVLRFQIVEADRKQHVVIGRIRSRAVALRGGVEGTKAQTRTPLNETHVEGHALGALQGWWQRCATWRPLGDSNPCYRRERAVS